MQTQLFNGALAGLVATVPMTGAMLFMRRFPEPQVKALPPEKVAEGVAEILHVEQDLDASEMAALTWVSHFGFGAAAGALYPLMMPSPRQYPMLKGMLFGLGVWTVSYSGWIPAAGILRFPTKESKPYVRLEVIAHLVWGAVLGIMAARVRVRTASAA